MVDEGAWREKKMRLLIAIAFAAALCACPKKNVDMDKAEDAAQIEDGGGEDHVVMDALVIETGSRPD
jgi:hypothetical protein